MEVSAFLPRRPSLRRILLACTHVQPFRLYLQTLHLSYLVGCLTIPHSLTTASTVKSQDRIPKIVDKVMDRQNPSNGDLEAGISLRNGPVDEMEIDGDEGKPQVNGTVNGKRKSRGSIANGKGYKEASSSEEEDDKPLVHHKTSSFIMSLLTLS